MMPLQGMRVLDFTTLLPGPLATLLLAEAGADVVKIERPEGDPGRRNQPRLDGESVQFAMLNRGKRSIVADLKRPEDRSRVADLGAEADILIEQFRPGVMERLGLGYAALSERNKRLIYCSLTGFGQTGPNALRPGHDLTYLARSGLLALGDDGTGKPSLPPGLIADIGGGAYPALTSILMALLERASSGTGRHLDIAMTEATFTWMARALAEVVAEGAAPPPGGGRHTGGSPRYGVWRTADGRALAAAPLEEKFWTEFCAVIDLPLALAHVDADAATVRAEIAARIGRETGAIWEARFEGKEACVELVRDAAAAMADPHFAARGIFARGTILATGRRVPALPVAGFVVAGDRPAPALGSLPLHGDSVWIATTRRN